MATNAGQAPPVRVAVISILLVTALFGVAGHAEDQVTKQDKMEACLGESNATTPRCRLRAHFFTGLGIDNFTSNEFQSVINPDAANDIQERAVAGFLIDYRLSPAGKGAKNSLWLNVETVHGVRSADIDCEKNPDISVCRENFVGPANPGGEAIFVLRKASSLEGSLALRWEHRLATATDGDGSEVHPDVSAYLKARAGFITVSGAGGDVIDNHVLALGVIANEGRFRGSYVEFGYGMTDLYAERSEDRWKADAVLRWSLNKGNSVVWPFARISLDSDFGPGSDSVQTYIGFEFDVGNFLKLGENIKAKKAAKKAAQS